MPATFMSWSRRLPSHLTTPKKDTSATLTSTMESISTVGLTPFTSVSAFTSNRSNLGDSGLRVRGGGVGGGVERAGEEVERTPAPVFS